MSIFLFPLLLSCISGGKDTVPYTKEDNKIIFSVHASKKYLLLPCEDAGKEFRVEIIQNGKAQNHYIIRLAKDKIDYWVPMDISDLKGDDIKFSVEDLDDSAVCLDQIKQSDTFELDYNERFRPVYHFTPNYGWMNDPNGMVYYAGEYHLFYQHNPFGTRWQNMSWGHAISKDLVTWEHLPEALYPDSLGTIFSGCAVVDENNTAGLQKGNEKTLLAFYTQSERGGQWQSLAYSNDKGRTWVKYDKNPILKHESARDFRDPKVFWHEPAKKWIMILAVGQIMEIYSSVNAIDWTYESNFGEGYGCHAGVWECPDLFELPIEGDPNLKKWVLICNINPGGPSGGSASQYFIGHFDGKKFICENEKEDIQWMDRGKDHYAFVTWSDIPKEDGRRIGIAWMSNWEYAGDVPTLNFRSASTVPRELKLIQSGKDYILTNYPVKEIEKLRKKSVRKNNIPVKDEYNIDNLLNNNQGTYELNIEIGNISAEIIGFKLFNSDGEYIDCSINTSEQRIYVIDRKSSGITDFNPNFPAHTSAPIEQKQSYRLRLLIDKASVECFEGDGVLSMTNIIFPKTPYNRICFYSKGGEYNVKAMDIYELRAD